MQTLLINLDRSPERLHHSAAWLNAAKIPFQRISAVDGKSFSDEEFLQLACERPNPAKRKRPWLRGQLGCLLSHYKAWEVAAASATDFTAIFEDDLHVSPEIANFLSSEDWIPEGADLIRLETTSDRVYLPKRKIRHSGRNIYKLKADTAYTGGYIISQSAAMKLISVPKELHDHVDLFVLHRGYSSVPDMLNVYQVAPALCIQDKFYHAEPSKVEFQSSIEYVKEEGALPWPIWKKVIMLPWTRYLDFKRYRLVRFAP